MTGFMSSARAGGTNPSGPVAYGMLTTQNDPARSIVIFTDPGHVAAKVLLPVLVDALSRETRLECVFICIPDGMPYWRQRCSWHLERARRRLQILAGTGRRERTLGLRPLHPGRLARRAGIEIVCLPDGNPNHASLAERLARTSGNLVGINLYCIHRFREPLRLCFDGIVNYHNGRLPDYRGLRASNWSIYVRAPTSGFSFHWIDAQIDTGSVLISGEVDVKAYDTPSELELRKAQAAAGCICAVIRAITDRDPGQPQRRIACVHNRQAFELATRVEDPSVLSRDEWIHRARAFLRIDTLIDGHWWPITGLAERQANARLHFLSADGQALMVTSLDFWPVGWTYLRRKRRSLHRSSDCHAN